MNALEQNSRSEMAERSLTKYILNGTSFMHPHAFPNSRSGAFDMMSGDRVVYEIDGRHGVADEFLCDGDAYVTFDDGTCDTVKWNHLTLESKYRR